MAQAGAGRAGVADETKARTTQALREAAVPEASAAMAHLDDPMDVIQSVTPPEDGALMVWWDRVHSVESAEPD